MKQLILILSFILINMPLFADKERTMKISVNSNSTTIIFELNDSRASKELLSQLPLSIKVEDYASNEKIFYPLKKLSTSNMPLANAKKGTLAYYEPWGNVVMFYKDFGSASGLYELGGCIDGCNLIDDLNGLINIKIK